MIVRMRSRVKLTLAVLTAASGAIGGPLTTARAQTPIELKVADSLPSGHSNHRLILKPWMDDVEKATGGKVKFKHFPGEQLGKAKDILMLTQSGVIDVGYIVPAYASDKMPLSSALELPGMFTNLCQAFATYWDLSHNGGYLEQKEYGPNGVVPLLHFMTPNYQIQIGVDRKVASLKDMQGLKIRTAAGSLEFLAKNLGLVPVRVSPPEMYEALTRGTIDGLMLGYQSSVNYSLTKLIKSGTVNINLGTVVLTFSIAKNRLAQLPADVQKAMLDLGEKHTKTDCKAYEAEEVEAVAAMRKDGMQPIDLGPEDRATLEKLFEKARDEWVDSLEKRGKPGKEALAAVRAKLAKQ